MRSARKFSGAREGGVRRLGALASAAATAVIVAPLALAPSARAEEIFHWVDEDGRVHFSDQKPAHDAPVTVIEIDIAPATPYNAAEDPYSILNQAARTHARWLDLEAARQARAAARSAAAAARDAPPPDYGYDSYLEYSSFYPYYAYWPANGSGYRPGQGRQQVYAMSTLDLLGTRPASINSGVHQDRVDRSQFLPLVPPPPVVQPVPR